MVRSCITLDLCVAVSEAKRHAFVHAAVPRNGRVRKRGSSCGVKQARVAACRQSFGRRNQDTLLPKAPHQYHRTVGSATLESRRNAESGSSTIGGSRGSRNDLYTSRNRMMNAANRRRWTEVLDILGHWEEHAARLDAKTYNVALSALGKCGRWKEALATLDRMRSKGVSPDIYSFNSAISACGRAAKWQQALALLSQMEQEGSGVRADLVSYNGAINAVAKCGRWEQALELLMSIKRRGLTPDVISFSTAMSACDRAGEWERALEIMDVMLKQNVEPNIVSFGTAISACARGGRWEKALSLLADIPSRGLQLNAHVYSSAMHACVVAGERRRALALLEDMLQRSVVPDAAAFTAVTTAVDGWASALRLLEVMQSEGVLPDIFTYNAVLGVIARCGREDVALALLNQMRIDGCPPDVVSFNTAIHACAAHEKWQEAVELLEVDMPSAKVKPDVITFTAVIHACAGPNGNWEKAYELLDTMWQDAEGAKPNKQTYDLVIQACGHGGEWELGVALIDDMRDLGIKPDAQTFNIAVAACARSGQRLAAEAVVAHMWRARVTPDEFTYASLVAACGRAKEWKRATEIFDEARYVRHIRPSLPIYGALLGALAEGGRWADVLTYLDRMMADGVVPDASAIHTAALAAAELGDGHRALSLLEGDLSGEPRQRQLQPGALSEEVWQRDGGNSNFARSGSSNSGSSEVNLRRNPRRRQRDEGLQEGDIREDTPATGDVQAGLGEKGEKASVGERGSASFFAHQTKDCGDEMAGGGRVRAGVKEQAIIPVEESGTAAVEFLTRRIPSKAEERGAGEWGVRPPDVVEAGGSDEGSGGNLGYRVGGWETATPGLLNSVLHALDDKGEDAAVLDAVERGREKGVLLNPSIYRCALKACGNLGDHRQASNLLARMMEEKITPDIVHWNQALRASAACARWKEAWLRLQQMKSVDTAPDEFSYVMALKACSAGLWSGDSWSDEDGWGAKEGGRNAFLPQAQSKICEEKRESAGENQERQGSQTCRGANAIELLLEMEKKGVRRSAQSFTLAMAACLEGHRDTPADVRDGFPKGQPPAPDLKLAKAALSLFDQMLEAGETPTGSAYAFALKACARTADHRRARKLLCAMLDAPASVSVPPSSPANCCAHQPAAIRSASQQQHRERVPHQARLEVRPWHLASALAAYDAAGDWAGAQELWGEALRRGVFPRSPGYDAVVSAAVRAGDTAAARRFVEEARGFNLELARRDELFS